MTCPTPRRRTASRTRAVPVVFTSWLAIGLAIERGTEGRAARCTTPLAPLHALSSVESSKMSPRQG
jgi:hypothetical protein